MSEETPARFGDFSPTPEAHSKSMVLLKQCMTPQQRADFEAYGHFDVIGSHSGACYRIRGNVPNYNVVALDKIGKPTIALCFVPIGHRPEGDVLLTQKIYLENDEPEVWRVANMAPVAR